MNASLWERRPRRDAALQTTPHRPEGGAPTLFEQPIAVPKTSLSLQASQARIHGLIGSLIKSPATVSPSGVDGTCPANLSTAECKAQGLNPGILPRVDSYQSLARNSEFYAKKKAHCISQGYGNSQLTLYQCLASGIAVDASVTGN